jgi:2-pyrone-4,6-dicarboxylate lactonase
MTVPIAGPVAVAKRPDLATPPGACDCHAHIFGPADRFPYTEGRGYTPPDAPMEGYLAMLDRIGCARGVVVQGNAHGYDNRAILDAVARAPDRLRGVGITPGDTEPDELRRWHQLGIRGLRFHVFAPGREPGYKRGVGLGDFARLRPTMVALGWHMQTWLDWQAMDTLEPILREIAPEIPIVVDHTLNIDADRGVGDKAFQTLLRLLGDSVCWVKVSGAYRLSKRFPDYPDARPFHEALVRTNPERLVWGTDWPHPQVDAAIMPDDGVLLDLLNTWTPDAAIRRQILVDNPARLYGFA